MSASNSRWYWKVAIGSGIVMMGAAVGLSALSFFTHAIVNEFGFQVGVFTLYFTLLAVSAAVGMPIAGQLVDRIGARKLLGLGSIVSTTGLIGFANSSQLWAFFCWAIVIGLGFGLSVQYVPIVMVNRWFAEKRGLVLGLVLGGTGIGGALLSLSMPTLIEVVGWRPSMLLMAAMFGLSTMVPAIWLLADSPEAMNMLPYGERPTPTNVVPVAKPGLELVEAMRLPWFYVLALALAGLGAMHAMTQHIPNYMSGVGLKAGAISLVVAILTLSLVLFKPLLGLLVDKLGLFASVGTSLMLAAVVTFASAFVTSVPIYALCMVMLAFGLANGTVTPPLMGAAAFGQRAFPKIWGVLGMAYPVGSAVGAPIWGLIKDVTGSYGWGFLSVPVWTLVVLLGLFIAVKGSRKHWVPKTEVSSTNPSDGRDTTVNLSAPAE